LPNGTDGKMVAATCCRGDILDRTQADFGCGRSPLRARRIACLSDPAPLGADEASLGPVIAAIADAIADALEVRVTRWPFMAENIAWDA